MSNQRPWLKSTTDFRRTPEAEPSIAKTALTIGLLVLFGAALQWTPGLDRWRWMPEDPTEMLPQVFRPQLDEPMLADLAPIDDEVLLDLTAPPPVVVETPTVMGPLAEIKPPPIRVLGVMTKAGALRADWGVLDAAPPEPDAVPDAAPPEPDTAPPEPDAANSDALVVSSESVLGQPPPRQLLASGLPLQPIEDPQRAMGRFFRALSLVESRSPGAKARVLHYGDSLIAGDYVTQTVRRLLQKKFGDGGHGFVLAGKASPWYRRNNLRMTTSDGWKMNKLTRPTIADGRYGLGGASFRTRRRGQWIKAYPSGKALNNSVAKIQVFYLGQPEGGRFEMAVEGRRIEISTKSEEIGSRTAEIVLPSGAHHFKLRTLGGGEVRLFGVVFETENPGVVYDSLGIEGTRAKLLRRINPDHWREQLRLRHPDLVILHYGTNESQWTNLDADIYRASLTETVGLLRQALPGVSCLLVSPMDRAHRRRGRLVTRPVITRIVQVQREVAHAQGCAFWSTFDAMGGEGSMGRWYKARPALAGGDLTHPTRRGADRVGAMMFAALMDAYGKDRTH